jgi:hypothetical protein
MNNEPQVTRDLLPTFQRTTFTMNDVMKAKSKILLENIYDEMILWNMRQTDISLRKFLGMSPKDYVDFMENPEEWAMGYLSRKQGSRE